MTVKRKEKKDGRITHSSTFNKIIMVLDVSILYAKTILTTFFKKSFFKSVLFNHINV